MASQEAHDPPPFDMESLADQLRDLGYEERSAICIEKFKQHPKKIALFLKAAHLGIPSPARAFFCQVFEKILEDEEVPDSTFREVCTNGLLDVLIDIALDARIYMWNKPTSSFYYPWLGVSPFLALVLASREGSACRPYCAYPRPLLITFLSEICDFYISVVGQVLHLVN